MTILLTHGYFLYEDPKEQRIMKPYPPLGLQYVSAYLEENGFPNELFDTTFASFDQLKDRLLALRPDAVGLYVNLMTRRNVLRTMRFIKESPELGHTHVILGGPEVRHHRDNLLAHGADVIVFGEGEATMLEVLEKLSTAGTASLTTVAGIAFRDEAGDTVVTADRPLIKDLDTLPRPARHQIDQQRYLDVWRRHHGYSMLSVSTMRGCPYGCRWCSRAVYGQSYRRRSPADVAEELAELQAAYDFDRIWFVDDVFTINHRWLRGFVSALKERNLRISYEAISRADRMNEEMVQLLRESGCFRIWIGAESGSQTILDAMNRMTKIDRVKEMVKLSKAHGIETGTFLMLGYPGETEADIRRTLDYLLDAEPDHYTITLAYPIKGTPFYEEVEGQFLNELDWATTSDRDIEFERTYPRPYYEHAMRWIQHEVNWHKKMKNGGVSPGMINTKLRSVKARLGMAWHRI